MWNPDYTQAQLTQSGYTGPRWNANGYGSEAEQLDSDANAQRRQLLAMMIQQQLRAGGQQSQNPSTAGGIMQGISANVIGLLPFLLGGGGTPR